MYIDCSSEAEPDDLEEDTLHLPEQEEEDLNRIKEESRRRREAIMEKYKRQHQQVEVVGNELKGIVFPRFFVDLCDGLIVPLKLPLFLNDYLVY